MKEPKRSIVHRARSGSRSECWNVLMVAPARFALWIVNVRYSSLFWQKIRYLLVIFDYCQIIS